MAERNDGQKGEAGQPLRGLSALVTGASRGIGAAIAKRLASKGAQVAINYRDRKSNAETLVDSIDKNGGRAKAFQADIADPAQVDRLAKEVEAAYEKVDILVNNAGVLMRGDLNDFDPVEFERMRKVNVDGLVGVTRRIAPGMKDRRFGRIINLTSIAGHGTSMPGTTFYAATKAAVAMLTRRFAMELGPHGITVNAIAPGYIMTDMVQSGRTSEQASAVAARVSNLAMVQRTGKPEDIANAAAFLADPATSFITAQILTVDGGRMDYIGHS